MIVETKRTSVVLSALQVTLRHLSEIPDSPEADALKRAVADCEREAREWRTTSPTAQQREALMKRVLALHLSVAKLGREAGIAL
jgi:acyl-CoA reductase-like NAD-dependent aldehyde dehydrogenase